MSQHRSGTPSRFRRLHLAPAALVAGVVASAALALATTGTLSAFTAQITNSNDTVASGSLVMQETGPGGTVTCNSTDTAATGPASNGTNSINTNAYSCAGINKYSGLANLVPGGAANTTTIMITNTGNVPANSFTLAPGACTVTAGPSTNPSGNATTANVCSKLNVVITSGATAIGSGTAASLAGTTITLAAPVAPQETRSYTFAVSLDASANNTYQNVQVSQPIVWTFTS